MTVLELAIQTPESRNMCSFSSYLLQKTSAQINILLLPDLLASTTHRIYLAQIVGNTRLYDICYLRYSNIMTGLAI